MNDGKLSELVRNRYTSWDSELGKQIEEGKAAFEYLEKKGKEIGEPKVASAKQVQVSYYKTLVSYNFVSLMRKTNS